MAGLRATNLNFRGYPGHIMLMKIRYGYGLQTHMEKMEILHSWYSDLKAYLPMLCKKAEDYNERKHWNGLTYHDMLTSVSADIHTARTQYDPAFEGMKTCNPHEKSYMVSLCAIKESLDEITAISKIIDNAQIDDTDAIMAG